MSYDGSCLTGRAILCRFTLSSAAIQVQIKSAELNKKQFCVTNEEMVLAGWLQCGVVKMLLCTAELLV